MRKNLTSLSTLVALILLGMFCPSAAHAQAIVQVEITVDDQGKVTDFTIAPTDSIARGSSAADVPDGGSISFHVITVGRASADPVRVTVTFDIIVGGTPSTPFQEVSKEFVGTLD